MSKPLECTSQSPGYRCKTGQPVIWRLRYRDGVVETMCEHHANAFVDGAKAKGLEVPELEPIQPPQLPDLRNRRRADGDE